MRYFSPTAPNPIQKSHYMLESGQRVTLRLPGGGGYYSPLLRDPASVLHDVIHGYVSIKGAFRDYAVLIDPERLEVDITGTMAERSRRSEE